MAQKFGNSRWVQEGFLDNREDGTVVGRITFAVLGPVEFYPPEIAVEKLPAE